LLSPGDSESEIITPGSVRAVCCLLKAVAQEQVEMKRKVKALVHATEKLAIKNKILNY